MFAWNLGADVSPSVLLFRLCVPEPATNSIRPLPSSVRVRFVRSMPRRWLYTRSHRRPCRERSRPLFGVLERRRRRRRLAKSRQEEDETNQWRRCPPRASRDGTATTGEGAQDWRDRLGLDQVSLPRIFPVSYFLSHPAPPKTVPHLFRLLTAASSSPTVTWTTSPDSASRLRSVVRE